MELSLIMLYFSPSFSVSVYPWSRICQIMRSMPNAGSMTCGVNHSPCTVTCSVRLATISSVILTLVPSSSESSNGISSGRSVSP